MEYRSYNDVMRRFPTETAAIDHYITVEHPNGVLCANCGAGNVYQEVKRPKVFSCNSCKTTFSLFKHTIFFKSSTDIRKWMYAIHMYIRSHGEVTATQLQKEIGVTYKTAWRILRKVDVYALSLSISEG